MDEDEELLLLCILTQEQEEEEQEQQPDRDPSFSISTHVACDKGKSVAGRYIHPVNLPLPDSLKVARMMPL